MRIAVELAFDEFGAVRLLNWLARENAQIYRSEPDLAGLYESGVRYEREKEETWSDVINMYLAGHEDCDALSAARAGELMARGYRALNPRLGDHGAALARKLNLKRIPAQAVIRTRTDRGQPGGLYHCIVKYQVGDRIYYDDPSARLGMYGYKDLSQPLVGPAPLTRDYSPPFAAHKARSRR